MDHITHIHPQATVSLDAEQYAELISMLEEAAKSSQPRSYICRIGALTRTWAIEPPATRGRTWTVEPSGAVTTGASASERVSNGRPSEDGTPPFTGGRARRGPRGAR